MSVTKTKTIKQKNYDYVPSMPGEFETKDSNIKNPLGNHNYDLFKEEDDIIGQVFRVKRVQLPNKGENWKVMTDSKVVFVIEGAKLSKKEKEYLYTPDGINFILKQAKVGFKSMNQFKTNLKQYIKI